MPRIPKALRQRIIHVANGRCEYCLTPQEMTLATFHLDHIIPRSAGGTTTFENLCLSCPLCNQFKQGVLRARDSDTGRLVRLFNPRRDQWRAHFRWSDDGMQIIGVTARGRVTAQYFASTIQSRSEREVFGSLAVSIRLHCKFLSIVDGRTPDR